ncbi:MAG: hypothetical protein J1E62_06850 [Lachnospiraceae bacterium]|nr:hypothetical protein [Lachnospiraceae bacterium]
MDNGTSSNGILMEDEIMDTPAVTQPQPAAGQAQQAAPMGGMPSPQPVAGQAQQVAPMGGMPSPQPMAGRSQNAAMDAFQNAPSFDSMDAFDATTVSPSQEAFGASTGATSTNWENRDSANGSFQTSSAGRYAASESVVMRDTVGSNLLLGLVGAIIGALLGSIIWIIIYQLGYLAGVAGAAIIGFSLKGYSMLGKGLDLKGLIVCVVLSIFTVWFAHRISWTIVYMKTMNTLGANIGFGEAYKSMPEMLKAFGGSSAYYRDLFIGYALFAVVGIPTVKKMIGNI